MDAVLLAGYLALLGIALWRSRSTTRLVVALAGAWAVASALLSLGFELGFRFSRVELQLTVLAVLAVVAVYAWLRPPRFEEHANWRPQVLGIWVPSLLAVVAFTFVTLILVEGTAFSKPVGFFIGKASGEDNAEWLDFAAQLASGSPIDQGVPLGPALALWLAMVSTAVGVISNALFGGYNEVAIAANSVVMGQYLLAALVPFALAATAEARFRGRGLPAAPVATGGIVLMAGSTVLIAYGHLTLQWTLFVAALWCATFLARPSARSMLVFSSLAVVVAGVVWLPFTPVSLVVMLGLLAWMARRAMQGIDRAWIVQASAIAAVLVGTFGPLSSALQFATGAGMATAAGGGPVRGIGATTFAGLAESGLFSAGGGTEAAGAFLVMLAALSVLGAVVFLRESKRLAVRFFPIAVVAASALGMFFLDFWLIGKGPNYGSLKFGFLAAIVIAGATVPLAVLALDRSAGSRMSALRWAGVGAVLLVLTFDSLLPRAVSTLRPALWTPPVPFNNTSGGYWFPAEVNGQPIQPISRNPVACVYLPEGSPFPTAIVPSGLSDAQRVYACTRLVSGLAGAGETAQPLVDWMRREWLTNTPAWTDVYDSLAAMPLDVRSKPVILLDDGSNVIGLESVDALLQRFPKPTG